MAITLADIRTELRANLKSSAIAQNRIDLWANLAQDELWRSIDPEYGKETATFTTTSGTRLYQFEASVNKILAVVDETNEVRLTNVSETEIERLDPDLDETGSPMYYCIYGSQYVQNQPSSASVVRVVSTSTADTTQTIQLMGVAGGIEAVETLTLNGTTNVDGTTSFTSLRRITKSATTTGTVTATTNSAAVTNITLPARRLLLEFQQIRFYAIPDGTFTMRVRFIRNPIPMRDAADIPDLPVNWHSLVLELAQTYGHEFLYEFDIAQAKRQRVEQDLQQLRAHSASKRDYRPIIGHRIQGPSIGRLPSDYPVT